MRGFLLLFLDGKWYLTMLTHSCFGSKYVFSDSNVNSGTIYAVSDNPKGPFRLNKDNVFIGGTFKSGYTCRSFDYKGKKYLSYIDKSEYGWSISLPKEIKIIAGNLRPCYTRILEKLRKEKIISFLSLNMLVKKSSTCFWDLGSGKITEENDKILFRMNKQSFQSYMINNSKTTGAEIYFVLTLSNSEAGIRIETTDKEEKKKIYFAVASVLERSFTVYADGVDFNIICKRNYDFQSNQKYSLRIILYDGIIEIYVNDVLLIQNAFLTEEYIEIGLFAGGGNCMFEDFSLYELL